jgi:hypothetical protein
MMSNGLGLYGPKHALAAGQSALRGVPILSAGGVAGVAVTAVQRLSAAAGHQLPVPDAAAPSTTTATSVTPWIVLAIGTALILAAWTASLRARPVGRRGA